MHEKYSDMKKLEESVLEVHDLFLFLSALVDEQAQMLDSIENNVENTKEYTGLAVEHITQAKRYNKTQLIPSKEVQIPILLFFLLFNIEFKIPPLSFRQGKINDSKLIDTNSIKTNSNST